MSNSTYLEDDAPKSYWQERYEKLESEIESLPKIHGWVARDADGLWFFYDEPTRDDDGVLVATNIGNCIELEADMPDVSEKDELVEVELLIRRIC